MELSRKCRVPNTPWPPTFIAFTCQYPPPEWYVRHVQWTFTCHYHSKPIIYIRIHSCFMFYESETHSVMSSSLQPHELYSPWNSPGQNTRESSLSLLQGIFPTQGSNPGLLHYRQILYQLSHKGSPRILEWVVYPFSNRSSQPRNWTGVSCMAGRFFTNWAIREVLMFYGFGQTTHPPLYFQTQ